MISFPNEYFKTEVREGFCIKSMMKRAWAAQLVVLEKIDSICEKYGISYFADWGTLLGAVRHGGYIPWDDDLDIGMKRADYARFLSVAEKELPSGYRILNSRTNDEWRGTFSRVANGGEIVLEGERLQESYGFPYTAGVDIFPIDYLPVEASEGELQLVLFRAVYTLASKWNKSELNDEEKMESLRMVEECCNVKLTEDKPYQQQLWILADQISSMYWDTGETAKEITLMYVLADKPSFRIPASCFETTIRVPFENMMIPIPIGYKEILRVYYGEDYMTPIQGTAEHDYPYYREQEEILFEYYRENGKEIPQYLME